VGAGQATITVTTVDGAFTASASVNVSLASVAVTGVSLNKEVLNLAVGGADEVLIATVTPANATNQAVTWTSSNEAVATVDTKGHVTPVGAGQATITVTTENGAFTATATVNVYLASVAVTGVTLNHSTLKLTAGDTETLTASVHPENATNQNVTWTSSNNSVATVDATGKVTAVAAGTAVITVTTADGGFTATSTVTVQAKSHGGGDNGGGNTDPGNNNGSGKSVTVDADKLANGANGKTTVDVPADTAEVKLPANTADLIKDNKLEIKSDGITMEVPSDLLKQLAGKLSADEVKDSTIALKMNPLTEQESKDMINKGNTAANADLKLAGPIYDFKLSITTASGNTVDLSKFDQPITLHLKVDASVDTKLAGIYYIADDGKLEFIGGTFSNGEFVAQISHFSKYAVLQVTKTFADVPSGYWAANVIQELAAKQIVSGTSDTMFEPGRNVSRAEFTALLVRALKLTTKGDLTFTDVKADAWYADAVAIAAHAGIVSGRSATQFDPNATISREEMVNMLMRAYVSIHGKTAVQTGTAFVDESQISKWATEYVKQAAALKLIAGRPGNKFDPHGVATRAEAAQVIYNLLNQ
ncbi:MAG: S-layer homology domain-containing protein, partial [Tumebacillaceae bacterium]